MFINTIKDNPIVSNQITQEYLALITPLQFLTNKEYFIDPVNSPRITNGVLILLPYLEQDQCSYYVASDGTFIHITMPNGLVKIIKSCDYWLNHNPVLLKVFNHKHITTELLHHHGITTTRDLVLKSPTETLTIQHLIDEAMAFGASISYPLICKPTNSLEGRGIFKIFNPDQFQQFLIDYYDHQFEYRYIVQNFVEGKDYRIIYFEWEVWIAYERIIPYITGDGTSTIQELIEPTTAYRVNSGEVHNYLWLSGIDLHAVLPAWESLNILATANVSKWWATRIITHELDKRDMDFLNQVARVMGAQYFGIDILSTGRIADGIILEINNQPGVSGVSGAPKTMWINYDIGLKTWNAIKKRMHIID